MFEFRIQHEGRSEPLGGIGPGNWFGEMALITGDPRSASVVTLADSRLVRLPKERFTALSERHPVLLREITKALCRRLARISEDVGRAPAGRRPRPSTPPWRSAIPASGTSTSP